ncbi:MAG: GNAT family N-acetyltransferase [Chthoniobacterales bacterium]
MSDFPIPLESVATTDAECTSVALMSDPHEWDKLIARAPTPHLPQSYCYGEGKRATGWQVRRAIFSLGRRPIAFATVLERYLLGVRVATRVNRGPVFLQPVPDAETERSVYRALRHHWRGPLLIAPALPQDERSAAILRSAGYIRRQQPGWRSGKVDLTADPDAIWASLGATFRNRTRAAEKTGPEFHIAEDAASYEWLIERHVENMRRKRFRGPSQDLLRALRDATPAAVTVFQLRQRRLPLAGMSVVRFGNHAEYHVGWFGPDGRKINAGNFLMWNIIQELKRRGVSSFDVGGLKPGDGYTQFKRTMNPHEYELAGEWISF